MITNAQFSERVTARKAVFTLAQELIDPIIEKHGLEKYSTGHLFSTDFTMTPVDQHLRSTIELAEWLMDGGSDESS